MHCLASCIVKQTAYNKIVRERTGQDTLESIIRERRLRGFSHAYPMDSNRIARQAMDWIPPDFKKNRERPRVSLTSTMKKDLDLLGVTWDKALDLKRIARNGETVLPDVFLQREDALR